MRKKMLQYGKKLFEEKQLSATFVQEDILSYKSKKKYDITMCQECLIHYGTRNPNRM